MSKISNLISALAGDEYKEAKAIYDDILSTGTEKEKQDAKYIIKTMQTMKRVKVSNKTQDIFWGVIFSITALTFIWISCFFV